jgi:hypothetical protein
VKLNEPSKIPKASPCQQDEACVEAPRVEVKCDLSDSGHRASWSIEGVKGFDQASIRHQRKARLKIQLDAVELPNSK